jgi:uncharacterized protein (DUF433 family)
MLVMPPAIDVPLRNEEGVIRVGNTRVTLQAIVADFQRGASPEAITHHYAALSLSEVYLVIGYYLQNRAEVDAYVRQQHAQADEARRDYQAEFPNDVLRERLLAALAERRQSAE